jgi:hypothetical protein
MIKLKDILKEIESAARKVYDGPPINSKETSRMGDTVSGISMLYNAGKFSGTIIDYGCGRIARNTEFLRSKGLKVYAYDPFWGNSTNGYEGISNVKPDDTFDVGFTSYVLNVVRVSDEKEILNWIGSHCKQQYHITRNKDIITMITDNLTASGNNIVKKFFVEWFGGDLNNIKPEIINEFSIYGTATNRGFQRIPMLEDYGYSLLKASFGYKIYEK